MAEPPIPTTDELIAAIHANRAGEEYPTPEHLLATLPDVLRGVCDYVLTGEAEALAVARALASIIDVIDTRTAADTRLGQRHMH